MPTTGLFRRREPTEPKKKPAVPVVEDPTVGRHQPVAPAVGGGRHADDR